MRYNNQIDKAIDKFFNEDFEITGRLGKIKFNRDQKKELWSCVKNDLESENKELGDIICGWLYKTISQGMKFNQELSIEIGELFKKRIIPVLILNEYSIEYKNIKNIERKAK